MGETIDQYGIIFDMDGVLVDTNPYHRVTWANFLKTKGIEIDDQIFNSKISGTTGHEVLNTLMDTKHSKEKLIFFCNEIDAEFREIIRESTDFKPVKGLLQFITSVSAADHKIALATSAPSENVDLLLQKCQVRSFFDVIVDRTHIINGKPDPEIYERTVENLDLSKNKCIVFEDSIAGIISAVGAGLPVIGLTTSHTDKELKEAGVCLSIRDFTEITPVIISGILNVPSF